MEQKFGYLPAFIFETDVSPFKKYVLRIVKVLLKENIVKSILGIELVIYNFIII